MKYIYTIIFPASPLESYPYLFSYLSFINYFLKFINGFFTLLSAMIVVENLLC